MSTKLLTIIDSTNDLTEVEVDGDLVVLTVQDQTLLDGMGEDHEPDGGWPDCARGAYAVDQAIELRDALDRAIALIRQEESTVVADSVGDLWLFRAGPGYEEGYWELVVMGGESFKPYGNPEWHFGRSSPFKGFDAWERIITTG